MGGGGAGKRARVAKQEHGRDSTIKIHQEHLGGKMAAQTVRCDPNDKDRQRTLSVFIPRNVPFYCCYVF